ncbi:hypothetical protein Poli38472_008164 [Pythium oligandrum]|uniref:Elongator complex protein 6 n=1 Tax=Pythium oligandrum TaxID=41045 RepID=A0A8K1FN54_PYTOL|nr:hypothetical protein Poli38472_008164 [Pythium oligandrum]|eukprot:TMW65522.1 hypothetical protein Poli38472_008164 [Pythium oligandrum]
MADALFALGSGLHWSPQSAPRGEFVVVQDRVETPGAFLVHHFLALFLKAGHRVCFLNFTQSKEHYAAVGRKLGVNFTSSIEKKTLRVIDCFNDAPIESLASLFQQIREEIDGVTEPVSIILDDLSTLKWQFGRQQLVHFLRCCRTLTNPTQTNANVVILSHADSESSSQPQSTESLSPFLGEISSVLLQVAPLPSGYFKDVHGTITVQRQCLGANGIYDASTMSFKVLENTIKCFATGGDALRSL